MKDHLKQWLPTGRSFLAFMKDVNRVWPGPGKEGLQLIQVGISIPVDDIREPHITIGKRKSVMLCKFARFSTCRAQTYIALCPIPRGADADWSVKPLRS
jgi:hypothetical protein